MYLHMNTFQMEHATYYAAFRYRFKVDRIFTDLWTKTALESDCFAYKYEYPYIFLYGIGGYTKVNLIPFYGETIKVVNETYYRNIPDDLRSDVLSSLSQLNESYLWGIEIRYDFIGLPKRDIDIFKEFLLSKGYPENSLLFEFKSSKIHPKFRPDLLVIDTENDNFLCLFEFKSST